MPRKKKWCRISIENLHYAIAKYIVYGEYEKADALKELFPLNIDEQYIADEVKELRKIFTYDE